MVRTRPPVALAVGCLRDHPRRRQYRDRQKRLRHVRARHGLHDASDPAIHAADVFDRDIVASCLSQSERVRSRLGYVKRGAWRCGERRELRKGNERDAAVIGVGQLEHVVAARERPVAPIDARVKHDEGQVERCT